MHHSFVWFVLFKEFHAWLNDGGAESSVPKIWEEEKPLSAVGLAVHRLLTIQTFMPDRLLAMARLFVETVLGGGFMQQAEQEMNLGFILEDEVGRGGILNIYPQKILNGYRVTFFFFRSKQTLPS